MSKTLLFYTLDKMKNWSKDCSFILVKNSEEKNEERVREPFL
jgi:hypothetical protein